MRLILAFFLAVAMGGAAAAEDRAIGPMSRVLPYLADFLAIDEGERSHFDLDYRIEVTAQLSEPLSMRARHDGVDVELPIGENGRIDYQPVVPFVRDDPELWSNIPRGGGRIRLAFFPVLPGGDTIPVNAIEMAVEQVNSAIRRQAGVMSFLAPRMRGVAFVLPDGAEARAVFPDGREQVLEIDAENGQWKAMLRQIRRADHIAFSAPPQDASFVQ
jgi:hypothetical protein